MGEELDKLAAEIRSKAHESPEAKGCKIDYTRGYFLMLIEAIQSLQREVEYMKKEVESMDVILNGDRTAKLEEREKAPGVVQTMISIRSSQMINRAILIAVFVAVAGRLIYDFATRHVK